MATAVLDNSTHLVDVRDGDCSVEIVGDKDKRSSSVSECCVDLDSEGKMHLEKVERDCRICHLSMDLSNQESIELGCSCKDELAAAHNQCAQAWFKIKGNNIYVMGLLISEPAKYVDRLHIMWWEVERIEHWDEDSVPVVVVAIAPFNLWQGHHFLNFLLACMVFAFVISWLFHFNMPA